MPPSKQTRVIEIKVDAPGVKEALDRISSGFAAVNKNVKSISGDIGFLKNSFIGFIGALGVGQIVSMSDEMQTLSNRLKIVSKEGENTSIIMEEILKVADKTNQSVSNTAAIYTRLGSSLKNVNPSAEFLLDITETLINTFRLSGSSGEETTATIIQLSQAFSRGTLRGQELNSVLSQNAVLSRLLRAEYGSDLLKKAEAGLIRATDFFRILW